jgi:hypothetical protein
MADQKRPVDKLLDLFVYAPLGLVMNLDEVLPQLVEKGHQQVTMARMFGQFAVQTGTKEARKRVEQVQEQVAMRSGSRADGWNRSSPTAAPPAARAAAATSASGDGDGAAPGRGSGAEILTAEPAPAAADLAIPDYDALSASQVVPRLAGLARDELDAVRRYEAANRGRKTILSKIAQLAG